MPEGVPGGERRRLLRRRRTLGGIEKGSCGSGRSLRAPILCGARVITTACFLVGRLVWESKDAADKTENIPIVRIAAQADSTSRDDGSRDARGDTPPDVQRLLDQYGDPQCSDFETQQQAQAVFELDQILFGDALDPDVNGASLATSSSTTKTRKAETAQKAKVQKILYSKPAAPLKDLSPLCRTADAPRNSQAEKGDRCYPASVG